mmetsp:Transcript_3682/g.7858  ORF Transcript_3682/g.7858 Transcript_3682/m.7858 type:complete len:375 (+) Transcript_3682:510-1634(+)
MHGKGIIEPLVVSVHLMCLPNEVIEHLKAQLKLPVKIIIESGHRLFIGAKTHNEPDRQSLQRTEGPNELISNVLSPIPLLVSRQAVCRKHHDDLLSQLVELRGHVLNALLYLPDVPGERGDPSWLCPPHSLRGNANVLRYQRFSPLGDAELLGASPLPRIVQKSEDGRRIKYCCHVGMVPDCVLYLLPSRRRNGTYTVLFPSLNDPVSVPDLHRSGVINDPDPVIEGGGIPGEGARQPCRKSLIVEVANVGLIETPPGSSARPPRTGERVRIGRWRRGERLSRRLQLRLGCFLGFGSSMNIFISVSRWPVCSAIPRSGTQRHSTRVCVVTRWAPCGRIGTIRSIVIARTVGPPRSLSSERVHPLYFDNAALTFG